MPNGDRGRGGALGDGSGRRGVCDILERHGYAVSVARQPPTPGLRRPMDVRAGAKVTGIEGSHALCISQAEAVSEGVEEAARAAK